MNFRYLLKVLESFGPRRFSSREVADKLQKSVKEISSDLCRLHRMRFVQRKRESRICISKNGNLCYKGFEYSYILSNQGRSYTQWMREKKPLEDLAQIQLTAELLEYLPRELLDRLFAGVVKRSFYRYKGPNRQFRYINNDALASLLSINLNLKDEIDQQKQISALYLEKTVDLKMSLDQLTERYIKQAIFTVDQVSLSSQTIRKILRNNKKLVKIMKEMIEHHNVSRLFLSMFLASILPEDKFSKLMEYFYMNENKRMAKIRQKVNEVFTDIEEVSGTKKTHVPEF